jgi:hypothetical protein
MSFILDIAEAAKTEDDVVNVLAKELPRLERRVKEAEPIFKLEGQRLEVIARSLPYHQVEYDQLLREAKALVKWLENWKAKQESKHLKNYQRAQRALSAKETSVFIAGEPEIVELNELLIELQLVADKLDAIVESIKQMGWMIQNMVKLRVAELHDVVI